MGNAHNKSVGRRVVSKGGYHVQGNSKHGQEAEIHTYSMPPLWQTLISQAKASLLFMWIWRDITPSQIPLEQEKSKHGRAQEVKTSLRKWLSPY